jgi:hypothetical protein
MSSRARRLISWLAVLGMAVVATTLIPSTASAGLGTWEWHERVHQNGDPYAPLVSNLQPGFRSYLCGGDERYPFSGPRLDYVRHHTHTAYDLVLPAGTTVSYSYYFSSDEYAFINYANFQFELMDYTTGQFYILQSDSSTRDSATVTRSFNLSSWAGHRVKLEWQCENWSHPGSGFLGYGGYATSVSLFNISVP